MINLTDRLPFLLAVMLMALTQPEFFRSAHTCMGRWVLSRYQSLSKSTPKNVNLSPDHTITHWSLAHFNRNTPPCRTQVKQHPGIREGFWAEPRFCQLRCLSSNLTGKENPRFHCPYGNERHVLPSRYPGHYRSATGTATYAAVLAEQNRNHPCLIKKAVNSKWIS